MVELCLLLEHLRRMREVHESGGTCYAQSKEWRNCAYGWHNPLFPPEYRHFCLKGGAFGAEPSCDLYYFMACYYERITGKKAPHNFEMDRSWKEQVRICAVAWEPEQQEVLLGVIACCTRWKRQRRVQNAGELLKTDGMKVLANMQQYLKALSHGVV